ncbi:MAG: caspase family protein, partial [Candidatus Thermoplasmatota archaeon]
DDVFLYFFASHGASLLIDCHQFGPLEIQVYMDAFASSKQVFIFNGCNSGKFITCKYTIAREGRIILASCKEDEESYCNSVIKHGAFSYYLIEALSGKGDGTPIPPDFKGVKDGYVSAEEAFYYAEPRTIKEHYYHQHPQIYDGIEGEVWLTKV